jgi:mRNA-degrading endonuclease RelE of RelBE toxin-antitoxin system
MVRSRSYTVIYAPAIHDHLRAIPKRHRRLVKESIEEFLFTDPDVETTNRKPLAPTTELDAEWELRVGPRNAFRVFYSIDQARRIVRVVAIGVKDRNRLRIGKEQVQL